MQKNFDIPSIPLLDTLSSIVTPIGNGAVENPSHVKWSMKDKIY